MGKKLVCGVGINDSEYNVCKNLSFGGSEGYAQQRVWICPYYQKWKSVLVRCFDEKFKDKYPSYKGCTMDSQWVLFSNFRSWMLEQKWEGNTLDKDILFLGNKHYSGTTCVFVDQLTNSFFNSGANKISDSLMGVKLTTKNRTNPYEAQCSNPFTGRGEYLGCYPTELDAHKAWMHKKHEHATRLAELQTDHRVVEVLHTRFNQY